MGTGSAITDEKKLSEGFRMLKREDFDRAVDTFNDLRYEYPDDYRVLFGYCLACTCNLAVGDGEPPQMNLLRPVRAKAAGNPAAEAVVEEVTAFYRTSDELYQELMKAYSQVTNEEMDELDDLENARAPEANALENARRDLAGARNTLESASKNADRDKGTLLVCAVLTAPAVIAFIYCMGRYNQASAATGSGGSWTGITLLPAAVAVIAGIVGIRKLIAWRRAASQKQKLQEDIRRYTAQIDELQQQVDRFTEKNRKKLATLKRKLSPSLKAASECEKKISQHQKEFKQLFTKWCGEMGIRL